jgi:hypothetical protein
MDFYSTRVFSAKKVENGVNFEAGRIVNYRTHYNSLCTDKKKHLVTSYMMVYKAVSHVALPHMCELSPALH